MKKALWITLGVIVLIVALGSIGGGNGEPQQAAEEPREDLAPTTAAVESFSAAELYGAYEANEVLADQTYGGRLVEVSGTVENIGLDILDNPYVTLETGGLWSVQCFFTEENSDSLGDLATGQNVSLIGTVDGLAIGTNLTIDDCRIVSS